MKNQSYFLELVNLRIDIIKVLFVDQKFFSNVMCRIVCRPPGINLKSRMSSSDLKIYTQK